MKEPKPSPASAAAASNANAPRKRGRPVQPADQSLRQALIERAAKLFRHQGYDGTSVRDIAAAAGVQAGSWFYHFKTKQEILHAVIRHGMTQALAEIEALDLAALSPRRRAVATGAHAPEHAAGAASRFRAGDALPVARAQRNRARQHHRPEGPLRSHLGCRARAPAGQRRVGSADATRPPVPVRHAELDGAVVPARRRPGAGRTDRPGAAIPGARPLRKTRPVPGPATTGPALPACPAARRPRAPRRGPKPGRCARSSWPR